MKLRPAAVAGALALAVAVTACSPQPGGLVVAATVADRLDKVAVPAIPVPELNLDAGFATQSGAVDPVTGRVRPVVGQVATAAGLGTFVRVASISVKAGDEVSAGQALGNVDVSALGPGIAAARADRDLAEARVAQLGNTLDDLAEKATDLAARRAEVAEAIADLTSLRGKLVRTRQQVRQLLGRARSGLAQVEQALAALPPGVPAPPELLAKAAQLRGAVRQLTAGLRKLNANLPKLDRGLRKARQGLGRLDEARTELADARAELTDARELARLGAELSRIPVQQALLQRSLATFTAPVAGVVVAVADEGALLAPGATVVSIRSSTPSRLTAWLAPSQVAQVCPGDRAVVHADWLAPGEGIEATLTRIGTRADYPPTTVSTQQVHLTRAVQVEFTATRQLPAGVPVELTLSGCRPAAAESETDR